jgi:hypothetical protein
MRLKHYDNYVNELKKYLIDLVCENETETKQFEYLEREFQLYTPLECNKNFD